MAVYWAELDSSQRLSKPFAASFSMHAGILALSLAWGMWQARERDMFGDPNPGFGPATIETVSAIPLPNRSATPNPVANETESQVPTKVKPEPKKKFLDPDDPDAIALRYEKQKKKKLTKEELKDLYRKRYEVVPDRPNQVSSTTGSRMSNPMYSIKGGGGQLGMGSANPFGTQLGWYADLIRQRVGEKWRTQDVDPRVQTAPVVAVTFRILRSGEVQDLKIMQHSGNYSLDQSTLRAIQEASPLPPLPKEFARDVANVEFQFQLRR
jgi:protein TonB